MKTKQLGKQVVVAATACVMATLIAGCATSQKSSSGPTSATSPYKFRSPDGRVLVIGQSSVVDGGMRFKNPHLEKCWIVEGFDFNGYDTLYIAPTLSTATFNPDGERTHALARENFVLELKRELDAKGVFRNVVIQERDIKPGARVLKLENTVTEYKKGGGAARFWAGLYGAGQPVLRIAGTMSETNRTVFTYEARRSGVSAGARIAGEWMSDEDIQLQDIRSMTLDLADFIAAIAGKYEVLK